MNTQFRRPYRPPFRHKGLAIGIILVTLLLTAAMGVAVAYSTRTGAMTAQNQSDRAMATALMHQAANIRSAWNLALDRSVTASQITLSTTSGTGLYDPAGVALPVQVPPRNALAVADASVSSYPWTLEVDGSGNPMVKLDGIGTSAAEYVAAVGPLTKGICEQINQIVLGQPLWPGGNAADGTLSAWMTRPSTTLIDMSADSAMTQPEQCIATSDGYGIYYATLQSG